MFGCRVSSILIAALIPFAATAAELEPKSFNGPSFNGTSLNGTSLNEAGINAADFAELTAGDRIQPAIIKAQVLLDRADFSPGEIDGKNSVRLGNAIAAFAEGYGLPADSGWSRRFWLALTSHATGPVVTDYVLTNEDLKGPFVRLPARMEDMRSFKTLGFSDVREALAEKFHVSQQLLALLNPDASFSKVGERILVPNVLTDRQPESAARVEVDKTRRTVNVYSAKDELIAFFPASVGSDDKPSPSGTLKVKLIESDPSYHYNPKYQFKDVETQKPFDLRPGPNNPLGTTWIGLSKPSYGIHGTPDPASVGKSPSHGCVRLTNWDAQRLAGMLTKGIPVDFHERSEASTAFGAY